MTRLHVLLLTILACCVVSTNAKRSFGLKSTTPEFAPAKPWTVTGNDVEHNPLAVQGGEAKKGAPSAPCDSNALIAVKTIASTALEAAGLLAVIKLGKAVTHRAPIDLPYVLGLSIVQWISLIFVIFSSSTIKSWIDGGVGVATKQVLMPNVVPDEGGWYSKLNKPWFNPPGWAFPIMWLIVSKPTQLIAVSKMLKQTESHTLRFAVYCTHLALGDSWNDVFFGCQRIGLGAVVILTFFGFLLASTKLFWDINPDAGKFMVPTCGWVLVATALNIAIYIQNPVVEEKKGKARK